MKSDRKFNMTTVAAILLWAFLLAEFTINPLPATFADDSAGYLLRALVDNPFSETSAAVFESAQIQRLPPLFSWVLAVTGAANGIPHAHFITVILQGLAVFTFWCWIRFQLRVDQASALLLTCLIMAIPGLWVGSLGILSEGLYALISYALLWLFPSGRSDSKRHSFVAPAILLVLAIMTRSIGVAFLLAWVALLILKKQSVRFWLAPLAVLVSLIAYQALLGSEVGSYTNQGLRPVLEHTFLGVDNGSVSIWTVLQSNTIQLSNGWRENLVGAGSAARFLLFIFSVTVGGLALYGFVRAIRALRLDAFYVFFYLLILLVWPYPEEQFRFLLPVMPIMLVHAFEALRHITALKFAEAQRPLLVAALIIVSFANVFSIQFRLFLLDPEDRPLGYITEYFRQTDLGDARYDALIFNRVMNAMVRSAQVLPEKSRVLTTREEFFTLLSGHVGVRLLGWEEMDSQLCEILNRNVTHLFSSRVTSYWNKEGLASAERFDPYVVGELALDPAYQGFVRLLVFDHERVGLEISQKGVDCEALVAK